MVRRFPSLPDPKGAVARMRQNDFNLESEGFTVISPRSTIKQAFQAGLLDDGHLWLEALSDCNLTVHTYEESIALIARSI